MQRYKPILLIATFLLLLGAGASAQSQHYTLNGDFAQAYFDIGFEINDVYVARTKNGNTFSTYMSFDLWYARNYVVSGFGTIPNSAFSGNPGNGFTLDMDINSLQAQTYACDYSDPSNYFCWPTTLAGRLEVHWDKTNQESQSYSYTYKSRMPGRHTNERGSQDSTSALANGNMLGSGMSNGTGWIGKTHNVDMDIQSGK